MEEQPRFRILGPLQVRTVDGGGVAIAGARERALLTRLLVDAGRPVPDVRLLEDLWPSLGGSARKSLQVRVSNLRRQLAGVAEIRRTGNGYLLPIDPLEVDATRFERAVEDAAEVSAAQAVRLLEQALDWWTPAALAELDDTPAAALRDHYDRLARDARRRLGVAQVAVGHPARGVRTLTALAAEHPDDESVATALVQALYADARPADAVAAHRRTVEALAADGLDPSPEFLELVTDVLRHDLPRSSGSAVALVDTDVAPQVAPGAAPDVTPDVVGAPPDREGAGHKPPGPRLALQASTPFLGRRAAVAVAVEALVADRVRLLTLWGPGGVGKTRLALEVARRVAGDFPEPHVVVDGTRIDDPRDLPGALVRAAGLPERGSPMDVLAAGFAERRVLVVVDNVEHLLAGTATLTAVLAAGDGVQVLVTSRAVLNLRHERVQAVEPLGTGVATAGEVTAVEFLRHRARDMGATDLADTASLGRIAGRLDGLPLALELAAARLRGMAPSQLDAHLAERLDALGALRDLPDRQRTLQATVAWSAALLDPPTRGLLVALGVFAAPARLDAIRAVWPEADLDHVMVLVDHALLRGVATADGEGAFGLLETVRAWAADQLATVGWADDVRRRHAAHHETVVARAAAALETSDQAVATRRLVELEADVERALRTLRDAGDDRALCAMVLDLWRWWWGVAASRTAARWLQVAAATDRTGRDRVRVLSQLAFVRSTLGDHEGARWALSTAEEVELGEPVPELDVARWIVALHDGALDVATAAADRATRAYEDQARPVLAAEMRVRWGLVAAADGDRAACERANREALAVMARHGPRWEEASVHNNLAHLALERGDTDTALTEAMASLATFEGLPFARDRWIARETLLEIHVARGEPDLARSAGRAALAEASRVGDLESAQRVRAALAALAVDEGRRAGPGRPGATG